MPVAELYYSSPIGMLCIKADEIGICGLDFLADVAAQDIGPKEVYSGCSFPEQSGPNALLFQCCDELNRYFSRQLTEFSVPVHLLGTPFRQRVWGELQKIPYGTTISYLELARRLGDEKVIRAAGTANGHNPVIIIVPCHRVIGSQGQLTGYAGGLWRKQWLLEWEGALGQLLF